MMQTAREDVFTWLERGLDKFYPFSKSMPPIGTQGEKNLLAMRPITAF
jgi:hypothetical protein